MVPEIRMYSGGSKYEGPAAARIGGAWKSKHHKDIPFAGPVKFPQLKIEAAKRVVNCAVRGASAGVFLFGMVSSLGCV